VERSPDERAIGSSLDLPAEVIVDLGLDLEVARGVTVRLDGRNVLDTRGYAAGARTRRAAARSRCWWRGPIGTGDPG
jgi:hypothetical protein